ncbi:isoaspartyl peptidase/L-asparaginase [Halococcus sediminicola]|uniref:isoaspartyl peptidase/L-asparaginase n=1 Tax=Halococcus sediminicola TaxID=1264579 RepID=UPI0009AC78E9|nr:isoaspartyl peptidase/L-asparaginase [Halococcus sediminicola]
MKTIVHGGVTSETSQQQSVLQKASEAGTQENNPTDAVISAIHILESCDLFNAGTGSAVQSDGIIRTDAGLMTEDLEVGAACSMANIEHAIDVARVVKEKTPHILISGKNAVNLASDFDISTDEDLWTNESRERWESLNHPVAASPKTQLEWLQEHFGGFDTVGAVATDGNNTAAATSTGGRWLALAGRVGDVPQPGSGFYCTPAGGVSTTGAGEDIARTNLSQRTIGYISDGFDPQQAVDQAIEEFVELTDSVAGIIAIDAEGNTGVTDNRNGMVSSITSS